MWILGGTEDYYFGDDTSLKNDVWSSADGKEWKQETANAPWSPRAYHAAVVHDGKIWVLGGGNYVPKYHAPERRLVLVRRRALGAGRPSTPRGPRGSGSPRSSTATASGSWAAGRTTRRRTGATSGIPATARQWTQLRSNVVWKERHEHSAYVFQDKIWVAGGHAQPLSSEVWSLEVPKDWFKD